MLNCPATNNTCPARLPRLEPLKDALSLAQHRAMDGLPIHDEVYRAALLVLQDILEHGCRQCVRNAVIWLANDMKWPPNRTFQLILVEELLRRSAPAVH